MQRSLFQVRSCCKFASIYQASYLVPPERQHQSYFVLPLK